MNGKRTTARWLIAGLMLLGPAPAFAQGVTFADLEGAVVEARVVNDQLIRRDGHEFTVQFTQVSRMVFKPGGLIEWSVAPTSLTPKGLKPGARRQGTSPLGKPGQTESLGGGEGIWLFEEGVLTNLRTYSKSGGYKRTFAFVRKGEEMNCTAREVFMREEGAGPITLRSAIDNTPMQVLSFKPVTSSCKVIPKKPGT